MPPRRGRAVRRVRHNTRYTDHRGQPCLLSSWTQSDTGPHLPPLCPCVLYMVHPHARIDAFDGNDMWDVLAPYVGGLESAETFHYDFYFLPGASDADCAAHYRGELAFRGTAWHQIRMADQAAGGGSLETAHVDDDTLPSEYYLPGVPQEGARRQEGLTGLWWPQDDDELRHSAMFLRARAWFLVYPEERVRSRSLAIAGPAIRLVEMDHVAPVLEEGVPMDETGDFKSAVIGVDVVQFLTRIMVSSCCSMGREARALAEDLGWTSW